MPAPDRGSERIASIERFLTQQQQILVEYQRENRQTFKEMNESLIKLVTIAERPKN